MGIKWNKKAKRVLIVLGAILVLSMFAMVVSASAEVIIEDDFESYAAGTFPSSGGWVAHYNAGTDPSRNIVTDVTSVSGSNSMQVYGSHGGCWASEISHDLPYKAVFYIEAYLKASGEAGSGCHQHDIGFNLVRTFNPSGSENRLIVGFKADGIMYGVNGSLQAYTPMT